MEGEVVEHDDIAAAEGRREHLLDVGEEAGIIEGPVENRGGRQPVGGERSHDRVQLPCATRGEISYALPAGTAAIPTEQIRRDAALIEKDIAARVPEGLAELPAPSGRGDIRASLFVGVCRFF